MGGDRVVARSVWCDGPVLNWDHEMANIPDNYLDLVNEKKAFANLATILADGSPQVTPVWFDYAGGKIRTKPCQEDPHTRRQSTTIILPCERSEPETTAELRAWKMDWEEALLRAWGGETP